MEVIDKWVTEFFIRCQHNPRVSPTKLLSASRYHQFCGDISNSLIRGTVEERTLDLLEILEKLLMQQRSRSLTSSLLLDGG
ncbi:hypothetical protein YC2023_021951 [Brassica napus]